MNYQDLQPKYEHLKTNKKEGKEVEKELVDAPEKTT